MGFGDPYHNHSLIHHQKSAQEQKICVRCELLIPGACFGCELCNYFTHELCGHLPKIAYNPLHKEHPLNLLTPPLLSDHSDSSSSSTLKLCNKCDNPCLGYAYYCQICQFFLHLKCFSSIRHDKHEHLLSFTEWDSAVGFTSQCSVCGDGVDDLCFGCGSCKFYVHSQCILLPQVVKHHHDHELNLNHSFPEECDQVYCDRCEDRDDEELDRTLSYYYCKRCDYIAHVLCVTQPKETSVPFDHSTHEHPLRQSRLAETPLRNCNVCGNFPEETYYICNRCDYVVDKFCAELPTLIKRDMGEEYSLTTKDATSIAPFLIDCQDISSAIDAIRVFTFDHPYHAHGLEFRIRDLFRCDACGELGNGFRMKCDKCDFSTHLECYALPKEFQHGSHPEHILYLSSFPMHVYLSRFKFKCGVCCKELDPERWIYHCQGCAYVAHVRCIVGDLISTLRSSIHNLPGFWDFPIWDTESFKPEITVEPNNVCSYMPVTSGLPVLFLSESLKQFRSMENDDQKNFLITDLGIQVDEVHHCPKCIQPISSQASSSIKDWESNHGNDYKENCIMTLDNETNTNSLSTDALALLDEQLIDELHCPICSFLIFPPTYSCHSCQIFFHKSCAELPLKYQTNGGHTFTLTKPPFISNCSNCNYPINGYAYICLTCQVIIDVQCAVGAPIMKHVDYVDRFLGWRLMEDNVMCGPCYSVLDYGKPCFKYESDYFRGYLHVECALLPPLLKHSVHQHPLELDTNLSTVHEYICDVCEMDLNWNFSAYCCVVGCGVNTTSHVSCIVTSKKKCRFRYDEECQTGETSSGPKGYVDASLPYPRLYVAKTDSD